MVLIESDRLIKSVTHKRKLELLTSKDKRLRRMPGLKNDKNNVNKAVDKQDDILQLRVPSVLDVLPEANTIQSLGTPSRGNALSLKTINKLDAFRYAPLAETTVDENPGTWAIWSGAANQVEHKNIPPSVRQNEDTATTGYDGLFEEDYEIDIEEEVFHEILSADAIDQLCLTGAPTQPARPVLQKPPVILTPPQLFELPDITPTTTQSSPSLTISSNSLPISPFLRASLPSPAPSTSLIPHLHPSRRVPTLFRAAEVHRLLSTLPTCTPQRIELYATVTSSTRNFSSKSQNFCFADLFFPHRPPYLHGTYTSYMASALFEADTAPFLGCDQKTDRTRLCRAIIQVAGKRNVNKGTVSSPLKGSPLPGGGIPASAQPLDVVVLNIWEASWEDVEYAKGIVEEV